MFFIFYPMTSFLFFVFYPNLIRIYVFLVLFSEKMNVTLPNKRIFPFLFVPALYHIIPTLSIGIKDKRKILYFFHVSFKEIGERNAFKIFVHAPFQLFPKGESWTRRGAGTGGRGQ